MSSDNEALGNRPVFWLAFLFMVLLWFCFLLYKGQCTMLRGMGGVLWRRQDDSTVQVLFKLVSYTELKPDW